MKISFGRTTLLVDDYDEALKFYDKIFDCTILFDHVNERGKRLLHIGFDKKEKAGIWLFEAESEEEKALVGKQTGEKPTLVLYTDDFNKIYERVKLHEVSIKKEPVESQGFRFMHIYDLYGNEIVMVEQKEDE
jgi:predicted enzyme related to lactoylglutathione lyase